MEECLVDILNDKNNVLHVLPVAVENPDTPTKESDATRAALKVAVEKEIVPEPDVGQLRARLHVSRGGQLAPYSDVLLNKSDQEDRLQRIRERAYYLWQDSGCNGCADDHWHYACELEAAPRPTLA